MQSNDRSDDPTFLRDSRSVPPRRISHYGSSSHSKTNWHGRDHQNDDPGGGKTKRKDKDEDNSDMECYNFEKLKGFHIPRKKGQEEKGLFTVLSLSSREYTHNIYSTVRSSFFDPQASRKLTINQVELVQNPKLEREYLNKRKDMKDEGRSEKDVVDSFGFLHVFKRTEVEKICMDGLTVGQSTLQSLGKPEMGVYVCKHADVVRLSRWEGNQSGYIIMFKMMKGRIKVVSECKASQTDQEPTPLYDCHVTKIPIDVAQSLHARAYQAFQYYLYEYGDVDIVQRPRQVLPYAVLKYSYYDDRPSSAVAGASRTTRRESSTEESSVDTNARSLPVSVHPACGSASGDSFCHWRGKLLVKNGTFCSVEIRSWLDTVFNVANIDRSINIKACLSLDNLKRQLPPTLLSKSAKKHNVIYRGRHYNTFTLHPTEEGSGLGKFRQLVGHLVQRSAVTFVPLRNNSSLYLLPISSLTEEMGLRGSPSSDSTDSSKQSNRAWKNFLHVITITPKTLCSKINDQRVFNIVHVRKRKEPSTSANMVPSSVRDGLEQKLRTMNIDVATVSAMDPDQHYKIFNLLKDKKKLQSEKMLHSFYKDADLLASSRKEELKKGLSAKWMENSRLQQEYYSGKKKTKVIQPPAAMKRSRSLSRGSVEHPSLHAAPEDGTEATFSDDEESPKFSASTSSFKIPKKHPKLDNQRMPITNVPFDNPVDEPSKAAPKRIPFQYTPATKAKTLAAKSPPILRPSFTPLEELIFSENLEELMKHPEFNFTDRHCASHSVTSFMSPSHANSPYTPWEESRPRISVKFAQEVPYHTAGSDCPYAFESDPLILAMLRAIHGNYDASSDTADEHSKVKWVRQVLHTRGMASSFVGSEPAVAAGGSIPGLGGVERKIVESVEDKVSPQVTDVSPHQSSTDSGFVSSSATATPTPNAVPDSPSLKEIAAILATALSHSKAGGDTANANVLENTVKEQDKKESPDMEATAKVLLKALSETAKKGTKPSPSLSLEEGEIESRKDDMDGTDMELGSTPGCSPMRDIIVDRPQGPVTDQSGGAKTTEATAAGTTWDEHGNATQQQEPRTKDLSHHPLSHPRYTTVTNAEEARSLEAIRKIIPGLSTDSLQELLTKIMPIATKRISTRQGKQMSNTSEMPGGADRAMETRVGHDTIQRPWNQAKTGSGIQATENNTRSDKGKLTITLHTQGSEKSQDPITRTASSGTTGSKSLTDMSHTGLTEAAGITTKRMKLGSIGPTAKRSDAGKTLTRDPRIVGGTSMAQSDPRKADFRFRAGDPGFSGITQTFGKSAGGSQKDALSGPLIGTELSTMHHPAQRLKCATRGPTMTTTTISTIITKRRRKGDTTQEFTHEAPINTIITNRGRNTRPRREADQDCLTQVTPFLSPGQGHSYHYQHQKPGGAFQQGGSTTLHPDLLPGCSGLVQEPHNSGGDRGGGSGRDSLHSSGNLISKQNSEFLHNILSFLSKQQENSEASAAAISVAQQVPVQSNVYASPKPVPPVQSKFQAGNTGSSTSLGLDPAEVNAILQRITTQGAAVPGLTSLPNFVESKSRQGTKSSSKREQEVGDKSPANTPENAATASGSLSLVDIQRIREKKQRLKEKKEAERALCRREAMNMRDELNRSIERRARHQHNPMKKSKPSRPSKPSTGRSPDSSSSGASADSAFYSKEKMVAKPRPFSLDQPASAQVLSDVAQALSDGKLGAAPSPTVASTRPTGVVTPTPRPIHPVFMQSMNQFPLVEVSSSLQGTSISSTESSARMDTNSSQVISEIDSTLSQLKQGMQANRNDNELKDSMAKLLQLVLKLGGASGETNRNQSETSTSVASVSDIQSNSGLQEGDLRSTLNARTTHATPGGIDCFNDRVGISTGSNMSALSSIIHYHTATFRSTIQDAPSPRLNASMVTAVLDPTRGQNVEVSREISLERDRVVQDFRGQLSPQAPPPAAESRNIDEILDKLRPFIENLNKGKASVPNIERRSPEDAASIALAPTPVSVPNADFGAAQNSFAASRDQEKPALEQYDATREPQQAASDAGVLRNESTRLQPTVIDRNVQRQPCTSQETLVAVTSHVIPAQNMPLQVRTVRAVAPVPIPSVPPAGQRFPHIDIYGGATIPTVMTLRSTSPPHATRSECGTPTLDERYPIPVTKKKRKQDPQSTNSFIIFNPQKSPDCEAIRLYLLQVKGVEFDVQKMHDEMLSKLKEGDGNSEEKSAESTTLENDLLCSLLPTGNLWIVCRTVDLKGISDLNHLSLLKSAGSRVQFVCADSVREVRARQYKYILEGDGGIVVPLCPGTLLDKAAVFRHLMLWLTGQRGDGKGKNRWRIVLHQHMLDAIQAAEDSEEPGRSGNADEVLDWLCHAEKNKAKFAIGLPEHSCDHCKENETKDAGKGCSWYDTAEPSDLARVALPCAINLQQEWLAQCRHVVLLVEGDPLAPCWRPLWQSGICVSTMERFVELVCSKPSGSTQLSTSCALPLYALGSHWL